MAPGRLMEAPILVLPFAFCEGKPCVLLPTGQENAVLAAGRNGAQLAVKREDAKGVALAALQACGMESQVTLACSWRRDVHVIIALCDGGDVSREELERSKPALTNGSNCGGLVWAELGSLNSERYVLAADAALRLAQLISPVRARASALAVGASRDAPLANNVAGDAVLQDAAKRMQAATAARERLRSELQAAAAEGDSQGESDFLLSWAEACDRDGSVIPPVGWESKCMLPDLPELRKQKFERRCTIDRTECAEHQGEQPPLPADRKVEKLSDVLKEWAIKAIRKQLKDMRAWHTARRSGGDAVRPGPLALGKDAFVGDMYMWIWDLRGDVPVLADMQGRGVTHDSHGKRSPQLNNERLIALLKATCVDLELLDFLRAGVLTKADVDHQIVIFPSLLSLYDAEAGGVDAVADEYEALVKRGWNEFTSFIPFAPWRCAPRGAVARKDNGPPRGIIDQGAPRKELFTKYSKEPIAPLNVAAREVLDDGSEAWSKEVKPFFSDLAVAGAVLGQAAALADDEVFVVAFDFKYFFHNLAFAKSEFWKVGSMAPRAAEGGGSSDELQAMTEKVMAMGFTASSQVAQRLANQLVRLFSILFEDEDAAFELQENAAVRAWLDERRALGSDAYGGHARLFEMLMYTDDPALLCVGAKRTVRALRCWYRMIGPEGADFEFAKFHKWQAGVKGIWLGGGISPTLGVAWVPESKALNTVARLQRARTGELDVAGWRELLGYLEHIRSLIKLDRTMMKVLWAHFNSFLANPPTAQSGAAADAPGEAAPAASHEADGGVEPPSPVSMPAECIPIPEGPALGHLFKAEELLMNRRCASLLEFVQPQCAAPGDSVDWLLQSDAALEDDMGCAELGGTFYDRFWYLAISGKGITIPLAEMLALGVEAIMFESLLVRARSVVFETDALASWHTIAKKHAKCMALHTAWAEFQATEQYQRLAHPVGRSRARQVFGEGNVLADAASRARFDALLNMLKSLGMQGRRVPVPQAAIEYVSRVLSKLGIHAKIVKGADEWCAAQWRRRDEEEIGLGSCASSPDLSSASFVRSVLSPGSPSDAEPSPDLRAGVGRAAAHAHTCHALDLCDEAGGSGGAALRSGGAGAPRARLQQRCGKR